MKKIYSLIIFLLIGATSLMAQTVDSDNIVNNKMFYLELGGPGIIMSMNYDMRFNPENRLGLGFRIGAGFGVARFDTSTGKQYDYNSNYEYNYANLESHSYYSFPVQINYVLGNDYSPNTFEIGAGASLLSREVSLYNYDSFSPGHIIGHISFIYRLQPVRGGFSLRVGFTPIIGTAGDIFPMGAISLGYAF